MSENIEKYKINAFLDRLTIKEYKFAMKTIPVVLDVSMNTFHNYRKIKLGDRQDIPYEKVKQLEILFGIQNDTLINQKTTGKSLTQLFKGDK
ncbi:hypothetical protein [Pedobacter westerhofensis]|nr:hypothetical protein [Pedobacter westerhofensis]